MTFRIWPVAVAAAIALVACSTQEKPDLSPPHPPATGIHTRISTSDADFIASKGAFMTHQDPPARIPSRFIDIHMHSFNANYLPISEIIHARISNFFGRQILKALGRTLQLATSSPYADNEAKSESASTEPVGYLERLRWLTGLDSNEAEGRASSRSERRAPDSLRQSRDFIRGVHDPEDQALSWARLQSDEDYREGVRYLESLNDDVAAESRAEESRGVVSKIVDGLRIAIPFIGNLKTRDVDMPDRYRRAFGIDQGKEGFERVLLATQQGSFGASYGGIGTGPDAKGPFQRRRYRDYRTVLMPATAALQARKDQDTLFFAAYDPFIDGDGGLDLAYDAVINHGAYGFKYYPPSGSRAFANPDPEKPSARHRRPAWRSRYVENGETLTGAMIDDRVAAFLDWAIACDLPVFTHANPNEFEAIPGYGYQFSSPYFWLEFMRSKPSRSQLRLCLGHTGGPDFWFGEKDCERPTREWGLIAAHLAMTYPNVYVEVGIHDDVRDRQKRAHFQAVLESLEALRKRRPELKLIPIAKKILYGSDWFMPLERKSTRRAYLRNYVSTLAELDEREIAGRKDWTDRFFRLNALEFMNAEKRLRDGVEVVGAFPGQPKTTVRLPASVADDLHFVSRTSR